MKFGFLCFLLGLLLFNASAFGELSVEEYEKIRVIVKETVAQEMAKVNGKIDGINGKIDGTNGRIDGINGRLDGINKQLDRNFALILALMALIGVVLGIPQLRERKKEREQKRQIEAQQQQILLAQQQQILLAQQRQIDELYQKIDALTQSGSTTPNVGVGDVPRSS